MDPSGNEPVYGIGAAARLAGSTPAVLRAWENRYGMVIPSRSPGGQRQYSRNQVDKLRYVQGLVDSGLHAAEAHRLLSLHLREETTVAPQASAKRAEPVPILLAERDVYASALLQELLEAAGYEVAVVLDPADAVALYKEQRPDLVVVELVITGGSGLELCRELVAAGGRIVAVSALDLSAAAAAAGAEAFLSKPLEPLEVLSTVEDLVGASPVPARSGSGSWR